MSEPMLAGPSETDLALTPHGILLVAVFVIVLLWLLVLTLAITRRRRRCSWHDGEPVYRRMPDGQVRFSWTIATGLARAKRASAVVDLGARPPLPLRPPIVRDGDPHDHL